MDPEDNAKYDKNVMDGCPLDAPFDIKRPECYDVCISDIKAEDLFNLGNIREIPHLAPTEFPTNPFPVHGLLFHRNRFMVPLVVSSTKPNGPVLHVWFLVDTIAPYTFIAEETMDELFGKGNSKSFVMLHIQTKDVLIQCYKSNENFKGVNVLGIDGMRQLGIDRIDINWAQLVIVLSRKPSIPSL